MDMNVTCIRIATSMLFERSSGGKIYHVILWWMPVMPLLLATFYCHTCGSHISEHVDHLQIVVTL